MNKKLVTAAIANEHIAALYTYAMSSEWTATVVIVEQFDASVVSSLQESVWKDEQIIVLTRDDLEYGNDVYSIELLHMQWKSVCAWWDDLLAAVAVPADKLRPYLEGGMRHVLIDLREAMSRQSKSEDVRQRMLAQYDRLVCGCAAYAWWEWAYDVQAMSAFIDEQWNVQMTSLWSLVTKEHHTAWWMIEAHSLLLAVVEKIDGFSKQ